MNQTIDILFELEECAVISKAHNGATDTLTHRVAFGNLFPRVFGKLLDAETELVAIDTDDLHFHLVANFGVLRRVLHVSPGDFRNVYQTFQTIEGHKQTELHHAGHDAILGIANGEFLE